MPLPTAEIQAFSVPTVKDGVVTQPVATSAGPLNLIATVDLFRSGAWQLLGHTTPSKRATRARVAAKKDGAE